MNKYDEVLFIKENLLFRLKRVRESSNFFNFSCPLCHEGKHPTKRRAYILFGGQKAHSTFYCHNCGVSIGFNGFLKMFDPQMLEKYESVSKELFLKDMKMGKKNRILKEKRVAKPFVDTKLKVFTLSKKLFIPIEESQEGMDYVKSRKIPENVIKTLYFCDQERKVVSNMVIFPFYCGKGDYIYGFQGRNIKSKFFHTYLREGFDKVYNIFNVDKEKPVYIFESIIDSLFVENSIAMVGADMPMKIINKLKQPVFCFDNDKTGRKKVEKYSKKFSKAKFFIMPSKTKCKDINELVCKDVVKAEDVTKFVKKNTFDTLKALVTMKIEN